MWLKLILLLFFGCHSILSHSFDVSGIVTGNRMAAVPLGRSLGEGELDIEGVCQESGMACQDCTQAVTCIPLPVGWLKVPLQQCSDGQTCNAHARQCSNETVPECDAEAQKYRHVCEQVGIFPDAYDCRKFHLCSPPDGLPDGKPAEHRTALCPRHYGYDPRTAQCSIRLKNGQCNQTIVPKCTKVGQSDALIGSPNHYYVCLSKKGNLYPQIFICPHGWYFWDNYCRPELKVHQNNNTKEREETQKSKEENSNTASKEDKIEKFDMDNNLAKPTPKVTYKVEDFFSTEKTTTYAADTFLADKFDLTNYETIDDVEIINHNDEFANSFEFGTDFW